MGLKQIIRSVAPSPLWDYLRRKKLLLTMEEYMRSNGVEDFGGLFFLGSDEEYGKTGNIFNGEQYYSQAHQDYFMDSYIFRKKEGGFF